MPHTSVLNTEIVTDQTFFTGWLPMRRVPPLPNGWVPPPVRCIPWQVCLRLPGGQKKGCANTNTKGKIIMLLRSVRPRINV
jgi:hypothetical protein